MPSRSENFRIIAVLNQYRKRNRWNIAGFPPSCGEPLGEATTDYRLQVAEFEHRDSLANPDMERTQVKKAVV
jgi:hypothetical protein